MAQSRNDGRWGVKSKVTISRVTSNCESDAVYIEIVIDKSHMRLKMTPHDFALCILGFGRQEAIVVFENFLNEPTT